MIAFGWPDPAVPVREAAAIADALQKLLVH